MSRAACVRWCVRTDDRQSSDDRRKTCQQNVLAATRNPCAALYMAMLCTLTVPAPEPDPVCSHRTRGRRSAPSGGGCSQTPSRRGSAAA